MKLCAWIAKIVYYLFHFRFEFTIFDAVVSFVFSACIQHTKKKNTFYSGLPSTEKTKKKIYIK